MARDVDALTSATLKHVRERWWDAAFTAFLKETLQPRPGNRILDVGCGVGTAELHLGFLRLPQVDYVAIDLVFDRLREARLTMQGHNIEARFAAAHAEHLPFRDGCFDSTFCVAVLQHVANLRAAVGELARVTRPGGRVLAVEPDNTSRYWYASCPSGRKAFELAGRFLGPLSSVGKDDTDPGLGPKLPELFLQHRIQPLSVRLFPVSLTRLGAPSPAVWDARREAIRKAIETAPDEALRRLGRDYLAQLERYAEEAQAAGPRFVEIQNTILFATIGQRMAER